MPWCKENPGILDPTDNAGIWLPDNKTISFPLKLFNIPKYKQQYEDVKAVFIAQHNDGEQRSLFD